MTAHQFFYKFDFMDLTPGNKAAGFVLQVSTEALVALTKVPLSAEEQTHMILEARARILRAELLSSAVVDSAGIAFHKNSGCPRIFMVDAMFGSSIGANPETFSHLERDNATGWLGPTVDYTPHNVDAPKASLAIMLLAQTWAEWAGMQLENSSTLVA